MVIVETQEIENPEIENNSGFSVWNNVINKRRSPRWDSLFLCFKTLSLI